MPKNTWAGIVISGFSLVMGFAMVWHVWWLAILGTLGMIGSWIVYAFEKNKDYYVEVSEVEAIERQRYQDLALAKQGGKPDKVDDNMAISI